MNRKIKNIIMILIIIIVEVLSFFTMKDVVSINGVIEQGKGMGKRENMGNSEMEMPLEMLNDGVNGSTQTPPEKPDGSNSNRQNEKIERPSDFEQRDIVNIPNNKIATSYYVLFAIESFIISILLVYLIMSNFNKRSVVEILGGTKKILIYVVIVIGLTVGLTFLQSYLTKNVFIYSNVNEMQRNMERFNQDIVSEEASHI